VDEDEYEDEYEYKDVDEDVAAVPLE